MNSFTSTLKKETKSKLPPFPVGCYNVDLGHILGRGSCGTVYRATNTTTQAVCAVKNITFPDDAEKIAKLEQSAYRELEILQRLSHKNIVQYYDIEVFSASWWIFLEYCESGNLAKYLEKNKTINDHAKFDIKAQCAEAVKYMHGQNIIHRDIKLENYLVQGINSEIVVKLSDFGLSKVVEAYGYDQSHTKNKGTMLYRSPEQFLGVKYSNKVDIFSLGLVLMVISEFGVNSTNTFPQSVEALSLGRISCIGIEMNERKVVTLMKSNTDEDIHPNRRLIKGLVQDMTHKDPCKRIDIQEVCKRLQQISATCSAPRSAMLRGERNISTSPTFSTEEDSISNLFDSIASRELGSSISSLIYAERNQPSTTYHVQPHTDLDDGLLSLEDLKQCMQFQQVDQVVNVAQPMAAPEGIVDSDDPMNHIENTGAVSPPSAACAQPPVAEAVNVSQQSQAMANVDSDDPLDHIGNADGDLAERNGSSTLTYFAPFMEDEQRRTFTAKMETITNEVPSGIYAIQYCDTTPPIMILCNRENEAEAHHFAQNLFGEFNYKICPTDKTLTLFKCDLPNCTKGRDCVSQTGFENDLKPRQCVEPGSLILAMTKDMWHKIQKNNQHLTTLQDVNQCHKEIVENELNGERPFMEYWSLGCFTSDLPNTCEDAILTAVHPLNGSDKTQRAPIDAFCNSTDSSVVYLTQIRIADRDMVKVLGHASRGYYSAFCGLDFLVIHPHRDIKRYMCSKIKFTCNENYVNIEPTFGTQPPFGRRVTKRGAVTGNTYGRICTKGDLYMPVRIVKRPDSTRNGFTEKKTFRWVDAFAVGYEQTECMALRPFADKGDSGSIIFDAIKQPENRGHERNAYGIVWQRLEIYNDIKRQQSEEIVCCKIEKVIHFLESCVTAY